MTDEWLASDDAFALFLATITAADLNEWEWRAFQWHQQKERNK